MTEPEPLQQFNRTYVRWRNREFSYFAGCDYFRLSSHPSVMQAVRDGLDEFGLSVAASRMTTGNHRIFAVLERTLAGFFGAPAALLVSNGYATNLITAQGLKGDFDVAFIDEKAHPSLRDASRGLECPVIPFKHRDSRDLARVLKSGGKNKKTILLTDGMFSHDGQIAPLREYLKVLPASTSLLVDDAHGAGVLGKTGKGTPEHEAISRERIVQTVTLSKAFGAYGGAILCSDALRRRIIDRSGMFVGSTPFPLPLANAAVQSARLLKKDGGLRRRFLANVNYIKGILRQGGLAIAETAAPIIAVNPTSASQADAIRRQLIARKVFPSFIQYPGGQASGYFRMVVSSEHGRTQLDDLAHGLIVGFACSAGRPGT